MTKANMKWKAEQIMAIGKMIQVTYSSNRVWRHVFYRMPLGNIEEISYKNGRLFEIQNLGR